MHTKAINTFINIFSEPLLEKLYLFSRTGIQPTRINFFSYDVNVTGPSNAIFGFDLTDSLREEVVAELTAKKVFPSRPKKLHAYIHLFSRNSFIPWHDDAKYKYTGTVYLNKTWDVNFGGLFLYEDAQELKCLMPAHNTGAFFTPPLGHTTTVTAINAPFRESLQIFVEEF
jgi:hypothetical protein